MASDDVGDRGLGAFGCDDGDALFEIAASVL